MNNNYRLVESCKYNLGKKHYQWTLYTGLYQYYDNYYYVIFDNDETDIVIVSSIVIPSTANALEETILDVIRIGYRLETLSDFYDELQKSNYGNMFKWQEIIKN